MKYKCFKFWSKQWINNLNAHSKHIISLYPLYKDLFKANFFNTIIGKLGLAFKVKNSEVSSKHDYNRNCIYAQFASLQLQFGISD